MQDRITMKMLEARVNILNTTLGCPTEYWTPCKVDGKWICNPLHFYIGQAYGGYRLEQLSNKGGGAHDISPRGTKREVWTYVTAMIQGAGYMSIEIHAND
jgi:hypothetical protein